jgi:large subunit ribosomal protein L10
LNRTDKTAEIDRLKAALHGVPAVVLADFRGMTVEQTNSLRRVFRAEGVHYEVVKNTLVRQAIAGTRMEPLGSHFKGNTAIAFHREDPVAPARVLTKFLKENEKVSIKAGWLDGKVLDAKGVEALSKLPGKQELRGKMLSVFVGVPTAFVRVLSAGPAAFVRVLAARQQQLGG